MSAGCGMVSQGIFVIPSGVPKKTLESVLAISVFQTPVGPARKTEPRTPCSRLTLNIPLITDAIIALFAASCPTTYWSITLRSSSERVFSLSMTAFVRLIDFEASWIRSGSLPTRASSVQRAFMRGTLILRNENNGKSNFDKRNLTEARCISLKNCYHLPRYH